MFFVALIFLLVVTLGGWLFNRRGPGNFIRHPEVKPRRNNWVP